MNIPKDVYEYIAQFADDKTILTMLTANKELRKNDKLFERVLLRKYPLLMNFKKENETWRKFYLRMLYYISKMKEDFDIDYIAIQGFDPDKYYREMKIPYNRINRHKPGVIMETLIGAKVNDSTKALNKEYLRKIVIYNSINLARAENNENLEKYFVSLKR